MSSSNKGNVIRRMNNEILQYYTPLLPALRPNVYVAAGNLAAPPPTPTTANIAYYAGAAHATTAANFSSGNVYSHATTVNFSSGNAAFDQASTNSRNKGDLVFECRYGKMSHLGESYDHYYNNGAAIEMTVSITHPCMRRPKVYFELSAHYPFQPPLLWVCHDHSPFPKYTCYGIYVERTSKLLWKIKALINSSVNSNGKCAELFDTWRFLLCRECFCCTSKLSHVNWKPTFHLIDMADEFYALRALKTRALALFHVHSICRQKRIPESVEKAISSYF